MPWRASVQAARYSALMMSPVLGGPYPATDRSGYFPLCLMGPASPEDIARWHNEAQDIAKQNRLSVPITVSSDPPRHGFFSNPPATGAAASGFSQWPEHLGLGAVRDVNLVREHADIVRRELTAVGIRVALGPTLDIASDPPLGPHAGNLRGGRSGNSQHPLPGLH